MGIKCVCQLQMVYVYLASGGFAPDLPSDSGDGNLPADSRDRLQDFHPRALGAHPTSKHWLLYCCADNNAVYQYPLDFSDFVNLSIPQFSQ